MENKNAVWISTDVLILYPVQLKSEHPCLFFAVDRAIRIVTITISRVLNISGFVSRRARGELLRGDGDHARALQLQCERDDHKLLGDLASGRAMRRCNPLDRIFWLT